MGLPFQKGCSSPTDPFYTNEKLNLENRNGRGLYSRRLNIKNYVIYLFYEVLLEKRLNF